MYLSSHHIQAVTNILALIITVGSTLNICNWLNMFILKRDDSPVSLSDMMDGKFVENYNQEIARRRLVHVEHLLSSRTKLERGLENWAHSAKRVKVGRIQY